MADTPAARGLALAARTAPQAAAAPKKPRTMYRWKDARGIQHLSETPPSEGEYVTLRSSD